MTMPHLMNCSHSGEGWCLYCVGKIQAERDKVTAVALAAQEYESWAPRTDTVKSGPLRETLRQAIAKWRALAPCPFCGGEVKAVHGGGAHYYVNCLACQVSCLFLIDWEHEEAMQEAARRWNRRMANGRQ